jgi:hypothetical protein
MSTYTEEPSQEQPLSPEAEARVFELALRDYERLAAQEQALINRRPEIWPKFIGVVAIPSGYTGLVGLSGAIYLLGLVTFFLTCIALDIKHDEMVLRYDVRKQMKLLAARWGFKNHDSNYSGNKRWWAGYYKYGKCFAFLVVQIISSVLVCWYFFAHGNPELSVVLGPVDLVLTIFTGWCLL